MHNTWNGTLSEREREGERDWRCYNLHVLWVTKLTWQDRTEDDVKTTAIYQEIIAVLYIHVTAATTTGSVAGFQHNWGIMFCKMTKNKKTQHFPMICQASKANPRWHGFFFGREPPLACLYILSISPFTVLFYLT